MQRGPSCTILSFDARSAVQQAIAGRLVLRYHFSRRFRSPAGVTLSPYQVEGAVLPFILVETSSAGDILLEID